MKTLLLTLITTIGLSAAPVTFTTYGSIHEIAGGYQLDLRETIYGPDRTATLVSDVPLSSFTAYFDNLPNHVGSGIVAFVNGQQVINTAPGALVQDYLFIASQTPFSAITFRTNFVWGWQEIFNITNIHAVEYVFDPTCPPGSAVPEPGTFGLMGAALVGIGWWKRRG